MQKKIFCFLVVVITAFFIGCMPLEKNSNQNKQEDIETRGIFISYLEYIKYFQGQTAQEIKNKIEEMVEKIESLHLNTIYLQVRPFSDSIYESTIFPFSSTVSGKQGKSIDLDILDYFIKIIHNHHMKIHAWINPYRISNDTDVSILSKENPAYTWLNTNHVKIIEDKGIFYNPASNEVQDLIVAGVEEIVRNYEVDGILFDDYFYPDDDTIDLENYQEFKNTISLTDFRLSMTNKLISSVYQKIKEINKDVLFGIAPDGNINNNYTIHYADIKKWLTEDGYIDYIMPQIYYGFLHETQPFIKTLNEWNDLIKNNVEMIVALSLYKAGQVDSFAGSAKNEWIEFDNIIKKQIQVSRNMSHYAGFAIFRYEFLEEENVKNVNLHREIQHYQQLFSKN